MGDERGMITSASRRRRGLAAGEQSGGRFGGARQGLLGPAMLLDGGEQRESAAALRKLQRQLRAELAPEGVAEELLVERIVAAYWRLRRQGNCMSAGWVCGGVAAAILLLVTTRR